MERAIRSELESFSSFVLSSWFSGHYLCDFVPTTVERASHKVQKLLCTSWLLVTLISVVLVVSVLLAFAGRGAWDDHYMGTRTFPNPLFPVPE